MMSMKEKLLFEKATESICDAINPDVRLSDSLKKSLESIGTECLPTASPKLSYSRAKLLSNKEINSPTHSPKLSVRKMEPDAKQTTGSPSSKHRPLSAASISSSSSTSSSTTSNSSTEHLTNGKMANGTYLASIESLADDHSENEQIENHNLTMCERSAMEILESEKNYVDDLGQIIKGLAFCFLNYT